MATAQAVIDLSRLPLVDADKRRYKDEDGLRYLNFGLKWLRSKRADLFIGQLNGRLADLQLTEQVPVPDQALQALADYLTARAETHDDEAAMNERAKDFFSLAAGAL